MQWKDQIRNQARIGHGISEASMPPTHLAARGTAPLVRICPTADSTITGLGCSSGCCGWFSQTPWVEPEACGGFKGALAAPLAGRSQKSFGREPDRSWASAEPDGRDALTAREPFSRIVRALERIPRPTFRIGKVRPPG